MKFYAMSLDGDGKYDKENLYCGRIYLHGKLEDENGYDICGYGETPIKSGIYDVSVFMSNGNERPALLYCWKGAFGMIGLVCDPTDTESCKEAYKLYEERSEVI